MKKLLLASCIALTSYASSSQAAMNGLDICHSDQNPLAHGCSAAGMLDVPFDTMNNFTDKWDFKIIFGELEDRFKLFGFEKYYQELIDEADHREQRDAEYWVEQSNLNLTDNYAYALVVIDRIQLSINGDTKWYFWTDVIEGTDWDNNGKVDVLEAHNLYGNHLHW